MYPRSMFWEKYENSKKNSNENCHFYTRENSLYFAWACCRNELPRTATIRNKIMPSNSNREITKITDSQNTKRTHCQLSEQLRNGDRSVTFTELV